VPFAIVAIVNATTITGGEDFRGVVNFLFTPLGIMLLVFSIIQFVDVDHRRVWGSIVALFCALEGALVLAFFGTSLYSVSRVVQFLLFFAGPVVGLAGGLWGVFWKRSWQRTAATPAIAGASKRILVGGSILLVLELPILLITGYWEWVFIFPAASVVMCGGLLYRTRWNRRLLGVLIISLSLVAGWPFYGLLFQLSFGVYTFWGLIVIGGIVLSITGALKTIVQKESATAPGDSATPV
jgi:hypothetical protein